MTTAETIALLTLFFSPVYAVLGYLVLKEIRQSKKIQGIVRVLDNEFEDVDVEEKIPYVK